MFVIFHKVAKAIDYFEKLKYKMEEYIFFYYSFFPKKITQKKKR